MSFLLYSRTSSSIRVERIVLILCVWLCTSASRGQFEVLQWTNFEEGRLPDDGITIGSAASSVEVVELSSVGGMPPNFYETGDGETGRYALRLRTEPASPNCGFVTSYIFDRESLGDHGRALFTVDIYLPDEAELPSLALLAMDVPADQDEQPPSSLPSVRGSYYRFGFTKGTIPYFSCVMPDKQHAAVYQNDRDIVPLIPKPGWRRLTVMLQGGAAIYCFIDGRATVFSPTHEKEVRRFRIGVMLADGKRAYDAFVDNISVQVGDGNSPVPNSPYSDGWRIPAGEAARRNSSVPLSSAVRDLRWIEPVSAWQAAQRTSKPLLMFFYSPGQPNSQRLDALFSSQTSTHAFLNRHVCTRIDVNQLQGGTIAREYNVFKVPELIVISPDAAKHLRVLPRPDEEWESILRKLAF